jgi:hypothetical protein
MLTHIKLDLLGIRAQTLCVLARGTYGEAEEPYRPAIFCPAFNFLCNGLRRFRVAPAALLLAVGVGWSAPAASAQAINFGSVNVCPSGATTPAPCSKTLAVSFTVPASGTLGTPKVFTQGSPNLDFTLASGSTCVGTVTEGAICEVNVTFTPLAPGQGKGRRPACRQKRQRSGQRLHLRHGRRAGDRLHLGGADQPGQRL